MNQEKERPYLVGERVILRMADVKDISIIKFYLENKKHLEPYEPVRPDHFYTEAYWMSELNTRLEDFNANRSVKVFIWEKSVPDRIIGVINLNNIVMGVFHACYLGYSLAENKQGEGYMNEGLRLMIDYAFHQLHLHRIMANYMPHNRRSGHVLKKLGFTVEGYARDYLMINGKWEDHIMTSLTNENWSAGGDDVGS